MKQAPKQTMMTRRPSEGVARAVAGLALGLVGLAACSGTLEFPEIRDVRPLVAGHGDTIVVELDPHAEALAVGAPTRIVIGGTMRIAETDGATDLNEKPIVLAARAVGPRRAHLSVDDLVFRETTRRHAEISATVAVEQRRRGAADFSVVAASDNHFALELFPETLITKLGNVAGLPHRDGQKHLEWLGIAVEAETGTAGLRITSVGEDAKGGFEKGDVILRAGGAPAISAQTMVTAWEGHGATVPVTVERSGQEITLQVPRHGRSESSTTGFLWAGILLVIGLPFLILVPVLGGIVVVWERKISGAMQSRYGPNRVGPNGWLQFLADGVKLIVKEDLMPDAADRLPFRLSPFLVFTGVYATFVVLPFSPLIQAVDLNVGILFILSITSLVVVGTILSGWASNSKWSLLGGMRGAAQIISYELPASVAVLAVVVLVGSLSMQDIVRGQGGAPWEWYVFHNPFTFVAFWVFFVSALAEGNRTPFDLPEGESELVAGFNVEYSGFRFAIFALAEWVNLIVFAGIVTTVFLGGWQIPGVEPIDIEGSFLWQLLAFVICTIKVILLIFVIIWIRWTQPRFRIDQMMTMCWKYFLPISLVCLMGSALWLWVLPDRAQPWLAGVVFFVGGVLVLTHFWRRVRYARRATKTFSLRGV